MAAIPVPSVNTPTYQSWGAAVAGTINVAPVGKVITKTTLANTPAAYVSISNTELGLATILGATVSSHSAGTIMSTFLVNATTLQVFGYYWDATTTRFLPMTAGSPVTLFVVAFGTR